MTIALYLLRHRLRRLVCCVRGHRWHDWKVKPPAVLLTRWCGRCGHLERAA